MHQITEKILKNIKPSPVEVKRFQNTTKQLLNKINSQLKDAKAILGGSGEKDTWLSGSHDVDVFVLFNYQKYQAQSEELSNLLEEKLKTLFPKVKRLHGSRDYFQIHYKNYLFEIIPILNIQKASQSLNITDISPLHAKWVKKAPKKTRDQIRLAKQFAKANNCYGAESYISGFSGYVLEILTIYYNSFENLIQAAVNWENRDIFDLEKYYPNCLEIFRNINTSKLNSPLIVIDPVDKNRNAAAALSMKKFLLFKQKAQEFLLEPSLKFFEKEKLTFQKLEKQTLHNLVYLEISPLSGKEDVVGTKLLKAFRYLRKRLKEFEVQEADWHWNLTNKAIFYFILEKRQIPPEFIRPGPPLKMEEAVKAFQKKHKHAFEKGGRLVIKVQRKNFLLKDYLKKILKEEYFTKRIKSVKGVRFG